MSKQKKRLTQKELVKAYLLRHKSITSWEAIQLYGCTRLSDVIYKLRYDEGMKIKTEHIPNASGYGIHAKYKLEV